MKTKTLKLFIIISLIVLIIGAVLIFIYFRQNKENIYGYCSMENNCPNDKCYQEAVCGDGGFGCSYGGYTCHYKNSELGTEYQGITSDDAKKCLIDFIKEYINKYEEFKNLNIDSINLEKYTDHCRIRGNFCYHYYIDNHIIQIDGVTCKVSHNLFEN